ncbi:MAG: hypothetical protein R3C15_00150 [Thermoleophilia bacterium]
MAEPPTSGPPSRLDAARARVAAAKWLLAVAAGAGFGWALLGAKLANPGDPAPGGVQDAPAADTGAAIPASAPEEPVAPDEPAPDDDGRRSLEPSPSRTFAPLPRTRAS